MTEEQTKALSKEDVHSEEEDDYNEDEDEDYKIGASGEESGGDDDEDAEDPREKKEIQNAKYEEIVSSEGGLIKTRTARAKEAQDEKNFKKAEEAKSTVDIDSFWKDMNAKKKPIVPNDDSTTSVTSPPVAEQPEKIKIKSTYEFAGNVITEDKWVDSNSAEAKAYLNSVKLKDQDKQQQQQPSVNSAQPLKRGVRRKRPSLLDAVINDEKTAKLSTLEKSRLDWSSYVDKEGIQDDLKINNKGGYLQKQDFLNRVQSKLDDNYKAAQQSSKK